MNIRHLGRSVISPIQILTLTAALTTACSDSSDPAADPTHPEQGSSGGSSGAANVAGSAGSAGSTTLDCGGAGVLVANRCVCDKGYINDPQDPLVCIENPDVEICSGHGTLHIDHCHCESGYRINRDDPLVCDVVGECNGYGELVNGACQCTDGSKLDPNNPTRCLSPDCDGRGYLSNDHCHCDLGYTWPENDPLSCVDVICGQHGDIVDDLCVCHDGFEVDPTDSLTCIPENYSYEEGRGVIVDLDVHHNIVKLDLKTMTTSGVESESWDLWLAYDGPGSNFHLAKGHKAINLGHEVVFHDVTEAPETGYGKDFPDRGSYVIGTSFRDGPTCASPLTYNVYVLELADKTYAKLVVGKSASGLHQLWIYHQVDGSRDLTTTLPEGDPS